MTTGTPLPICPEIAFMKENYIQTMLKVICFLLLVKNKCMNKSQMSWFSTWCPAPHLPFSILVQAAILLQSAAVMSTQQDQPGSESSRAPRDLRNSKGAKEGEQNVFKLQMLLRYLRTHVLEVDFLPRIWSSSEEDKGQGC